MKSAVVAPIGANGDSWLVMLFFTKLRIANWRPLAPRDENQVGANGDGHTIFHSTAHRQLAMSPIGANSWRQLAPRWRQ